MKKLILLLVLCAGVAVSQERFPFAGSTDATARASAATAQATADSALAGGAGADSAVFATKYFTASTYAPLATYLDPADSTIMHDFNAATYAPKASPTFTGTVGGINFFDLDSVQAPSFSYNGYLAQLVDVGEGGPYRLEWLANTFLAPADSDDFRGYSNYLYAQAPGPSFSFVAYDYSPHDWTWPVYEDGTWHEIYITDYFAKSDSGGTTIQTLTENNALYQPTDADLTTIAGLTATTGNMILSVGSAWASSTPSTVKTALSLNNVTNESKATMFTSPAFTTGVTFPTAWTGTLRVASGVASATASDTVGLGAALAAKMAAAAFADSAREHSVGVGTLTAGERVYAAGADSIYSRPDTVLLFAASIGIGMATDTALFRTTYKYPSLLHDATCNDTLVITKIVGVVGGSSPDVDVKFAYDVNNYDGTPTYVNTTALTVTSTTTGSSTTTINNAAIVPGRFLWPELTETAAQPTSLRLFVYGLRKPE